MEDLCITDDFHTIISLEHINQTTTQVFVPLIFWDFIFFKHYGISKPPMEFNNWFWKLVIQDGPILCKTGFIICDRFGMPKWEFFLFLVELWSIGAIIRTFTLDATGLELLGKEWKIFVLYISNDIFMRIYPNLLLTIFNIEEIIYL